MYFVLKSLKFIYIIPLWEAPDDGHNGVRNM